MGVNFLPDYYVDITDVFEEKCKAIMCHKSQSPKKFVEATKLMNRYRSAQCNYLFGYAECYSYDRIFPFSDINHLLIHNIKMQPYYSNNEISML